MPLDVFEALSKPPVIIGGRASAQIEREPKPCGQERVPKYSDRDYATEYILEEEKKYKVMPIHQVMQSTLVYLEKKGYISEEMISELWHKDRQR